MVINYIINAWRLMHDSNTIFIFSHPESTMNKVLDFGVHNLFIKLFYICYQRVNTNMWLYQYFYLTF